MGEHAKLVKQGEYLAKAGDCIACHTAPDGKPFAGGLGIKTPFGTIYSQNITPDKKTGIGDWTDKQFIRAMRQGIAPNGSYYFPVFPYTDFNKMSKKDLLAIKTYLEALTPVEKTNREPDMSWPFRWRFMQLGWRLLFFQFYKGEFKPNPKKSIEWNRGAYLVKGLGHCGMCHTPLNFLGGQKNKYYLKGGFVEGFHAPNISRSHFKDTPIKEIVAVFKQDRLVEGGRVVGPMSEVNHDSLIYLTDNDLKSIATYLKTVKSHPLPKRKVVTTVNLKVGKNIYSTYCASCHTTGAGGAPKLGDHNSWAPLIKLGRNTLNKNAIKGFKDMPPKGTCTQCSNAEIQSAVEYMVSEATIETSEQVEKASPIKLPKKTLAEGEKIYKRVCAICHNEGKLDAPKIGDKTTWHLLIKKNMDTLFRHTIKGYKNMPARGACNDCTDAQIIAAVKYMVEKSKTDGDYIAW